MTKGLHKDSLQKIDNPHQWMIDDAEQRLILRIKAEIERQREEIRPTDTGEMKVVGTPTQLEQGWLNALSWMEKVLDTLQEQPVMIEWTGNNLKEVIEFTGKSPRFDEWFKTWDEYESYVHSHGDILKLFNEDGTHLEVPVGAWIVKTPDGRNVPSTFLYKEQPFYGFELKFKAESALNKFTSKNCVHCSIEHCPGVKACYTSSNKQLQ